jgi:hypothetical protein
MNRMPSGGARALHLPDWPFGAVGRRLLLQALLIETPPKRGWTKSDLEARAEVGNGGLDEVLAGALQLKLIEQRDGRWHRPEKLPPIARPLKALVEASADVPDTPIDPLPRRTYKRRD